jgi:hypothetical protein
MNVETTVKAWGVGWLIALLVLVAVLIIWLASTALTPGLILLLISALAFARLL